MYRISASLMNLYAIPFQRNTRFARGLASHRPLAVRSLINTWRKSKSTRIPCKIVTPSRDKHDFSRSFAVPPLQVAAYALLFLFWLGSHLSEAHNEIEEEVTPHIVWEYCGYGSQWIKQCFVALFQVHLYAIGYCSSFPLVSWGICLIQEDSMSNKGFPYTTIMHLQYDLAQCPVYLVPPTRGLTKGKASLALSW